MRKNTYKKVKQNNKAFKQVILNNFKEIQEQIISIKRDMNEEIEKRITERLGDYVHRIESALDGVIAMKEIFIKKGFFTRKEYNNQKAKMRKKNGNLLRRLFRRKRR